MTWDEFLAARPVGVVATIGPDGAPHAVPVEVVVRDGRVYVWCRATSVKARNAARTGRAAVTAYKGNSMVLVRGAARLVQDGDDGYAEITQAFLDKYDRTETYGNDALIEISPERTTLKEH